MSIIVIASLFAFYLAWNLGANDVANAMGTSVGSKALTLVQALVVAGILEFLGAVWLGRSVSSQLATGIIDGGAIAANVFVWSMIAVLLAAGLWMNLATFLGLPVSSSHAVVGAIAGVGYAAAGAQAVHWDTLGLISLTWLVTPIVSGAFAGLIYGVIRWIWLRNEGDDPKSNALAIEAWMARLQVVSACSVAFAHGSNDVGNAIAPLAAIVSVQTTSQIPGADFSVPTWTLVLGGVGIVGGLAVWGQKVIYTIGENIAPLQPSSGFCAELATALTVLLATQGGLPVSTSHALVGGVVGVTLMHPKHQVQWSTLRSIGLTWVATIPASAALAIGIFKSIVWLSLRGTIH